MATSSPTLPSDADELLTLVGGLVADSRDDGIYVDGVQIVKWRPTTIVIGTPHGPTGEPAFTTASSSWPKSHTGSWAGTVTIATALSVSSGKHRITYDFTHSSSLAVQYSGVRYRLDRQKWLGAAWSFTGGAANSGTIQTSSTTSTTVLSAWDTGNTAFDMTVSGTTRALHFTLVAGAGMMLYDEGSDGDIVLFIGRASSTLTGVATTVTVDVWGHASSGATATYQIWDGAITIPNAAPYISIGTDVTCLSSSGTRCIMGDERILRSAPTERLTYQGNRAFYKNQLYPVFGTTLSAGVICTLSQANMVILAADLKRRGYNWIRFHHFDQTTALLASGGRWYVVDAARLANFHYFINLIREFAFYELDGNSIMGNTTGLDNTSSDEIWSGATGLTGFKAIAPHSAAATTQLRAYWTNFLLVDSGYSWGSIAEDPAFALFTLLNEDIPYSTVSGDAGSLLNAAYGGTFDTSNQATRVFDCAARTTWFNAQVAWLEGQGCDVPCTMGAEFCQETARRGDYASLYTAIAASGGVITVHEYKDHPSASGVPITHTQALPLAGAASITNLFTSSRADVGAVSGPTFYQEIGGPAHAKARAEATILMSIDCLANGRMGINSFEHTDGSWDPTTPAAIRQFDVVTDRCRDVGDMVAQRVLQCGLNGYGSWTAIASANGWSGYEEFAMNSYTWEWKFSAPRLVAAALEVGSSATMRGVTFTNTGGARAVFALMPMLGGSIGNSRRYFAAHITWTERIGNVYSSNLRTVISTLGASGTAVRVGTGTISIPTQNPSNWTVYRIGNDGARGSTVTNTPASLSTSFAVSNASTPSLLYELVRSAGI